MSLLRKGVTFKRGLAGLEVFHRGEKSRAGKSNIKFI